MMDAKGRVLLPMALRKQMLEEGSDVFVLRKDIYESCLVLYSKDEWDRQTEILGKKLNPYNRQHNEFLRLYYKDVERVEIDSVGRILISARMKTLAGLDKELVLAGQLGKVEIWSKTQYDNSTKMDQFSVLAEKLLGASPIESEDI